MDIGRIRRIDELGRIVIPKEIRKSLRIKDGDPLEIYTSKDELILKKYSPVALMNDYAQSMCDGIYELTKKTCIITDNDEVLCSSQNNAKDMVGRKITSELFDTIKERKSLVLSKSEGGNILKIVKDQEDNIENQSIVPIISQGDCYGSLIICDNDKNTKFDNSIIKLIQLGAKVISKQFEY